MKNAKGNGCNINLDGTDLDEGRCLEVEERWKK